MGGNGQNVLTTMIAELVLGEKVVIALVAQRTLKIVHGVLYQWKTRINGSMEPLQGTASAFRLLVVNFVLLGPTTG